jgi:hypothetical protein
MIQQYQTKRLTFSAPPRCSEEHPGGLWSTRSWLAADVASAKSAGAWFAKGRHDFADREAALAAGVAE